MEIVNENKVISTINNEVKTTGSIEVDVIENKDLKVEVQRREYSIVGDELYIPKRYEDAPQWLRDLISTVTNESFNQKITELNGLSATLNQLIVELEVAKNTYTQSIISSNDIDERINTAVTTLNSSIAQSDATLVNMINTRATPDEASTLALNVLNSSIENGAINALASSIQNSSVTRDQALANDISLVHSEMTGEFEATSEAITSLSTYVGVDASTFVADGTGLLAKVEILEKQADGVIETITGTYDVMLGNNDLTYDLVEDAEPYASWVSSEESDSELVRASHVGDVYIKYQNETNGTKTYLAAYKFIKTVVDTTAPYGTDDKGYTWAIVTDTDTQNAYMAALKAYDLADGKRRVFVTTPFGPYETGDLWTDPTGELKRCKDGIVNLVIGSYNEIDWELATGYTENLQAYTDSVVDELSINLQNQIDGKIEYWFNISTNDPKAAWTTTELKLKHNGDIWYQTDTKISYYYSKVTDTWNLITNKDALDAIELANTAQATADGKVTVYYALEQATAPSTTSLWYKTTDTKLYKYTTSWVLVAPLAVGDLLYTNNGTEDNRPYRFNGTSWVSARDGKVIATANALTQLSTNVLDPTTGAIVTAVNNVEQSLRTEIEDGDSTVESKWAYNSTVELAGVPYSSGFGMVTSASNINGKPASGSEFWISADKFKFTNANNTGAKAPFTIDATGTTPEITFNGKVSFTNVTDYVEPDISGEINSNNDAFAISQGFSSYADMQAKYSALGKTIINSGYINTGLVNADSIVANSISANKISSYNLTATNATVENGFIKNAMIDDLAVDTLKLADQSVTIPFSVNNLGSINFDTSYIEAVSSSFTSSGAPVNLTFSSLISAGSLRLITALVTRNGVTIYERPTLSIGQSAGQYGTLNFTLRDTPSSGVTTYILYLKSSATGTTASYRSIIGMEVKK